MSQLWKELHERAVIYTGTDDKLFIQGWAAKLPRFTQGCACNEFWRAWYSRNPAPFSPEGAYFAWSVKAHNAVNAKLGKKIMTVEEAMSLWGPKDRHVVKNVKVEVVKEEIKVEVVKVVKEEVKEEVKVEKVKEEVKEEVKEVVKEVEVKIIESTNDVPSQNKELVKPVPEIHGPNATPLPVIRDPINVSWRPRVPQHRVKPIIQKNLWLPPKYK